ncbi:MAG TPA: HAD-IA family hydrolase, partial [Candidatus Nanoarchaeia archaeon]|nr:HAD-IA family hydrolase [Candidatus Nanoarchaeia archaeon]
FDGPVGNLSNDPDLWVRARVGEVDDETVFENIAQRFNVDTQIVKSWFFSRREPDPDVLEILDKLNPEIKVGIINNGLKTLFRGYLDQFQLKDRFDFTVNSAEVGFEKPDQRIYELAFKSLDVKPDECLFADDNESNVAGAEKLGMRVLLYKKPGDLEVKLVELGLVEK